jgi:hypothetical protein
MSSLHTKLQPNPRIRSKVAPPQMFKRQPLWSDQRHLQCHHLHTKYQPNPPISSNVCMRVWEWMKEMRTSVWDFKRSSACRKILNMGPPALLPIPRKVCCGFVLHLKINRIAWARTRELWIQWQAQWPLHHRGDLPIGDREQIYCVAQLCQINCLRFRSYASCLLSSVWMLDSETKVGLERIQTL